MVNESLEVQAINQILSGASSWNVYESERLFTNILLVSPATIPYFYNKNSAGSYEIFYLNKNKEISDFLEDRKDYEKRVKTKELIVFDSNSSDDPGFIFGNVVRYLRNSETDRGSIRRFLIKKEDWRVANTSLTINLLDHLVDLTDNSLVSKIIRGESF